MPGQTPIPGTDTFDVTSIVIGEPDFANPGAIIDVGETFSLTALFEGSGDNWRNMTRWNVPYRVIYTIDALTAPSPERSVGQVDSTLIPDQFSYGNGQTDLTITDGRPSGWPSPIPEGVYKVIAVVTFPTGTGWLGYSEAMLQVNKLEDF